MARTDDKAHAAHGDARTIDRVDVHSHFIPDFYRQTLIDEGLSQPDGIHAIPEWSEDSALDVMDRLGVRTAFLSISSPGVHFGDDEKSRALARKVNTEGARLKGAHPDRFGFFAALPLPDVAGAVDEVVYSFDTLGADGVIIESNQDGTYLGDPSLDPLYQALDERGAVLLVHPTSPATSCSARLDELYPRPLMEFIFETTRSVSDMVLAGVLERYPNLRVIVPHAGAALPILTSRIDGGAAVLGRAGGPKLPSTTEAMRKLHFDVAGSPVPNLLGALLAVADSANIHYGSDYPFTPAGACDALAHAIENTDLLDDATRQNILSDNALALFPHLAHVWEQHS